MRKEKTLVMFTLNFPFGNGEEFIETELRVASEHYDRIFVVPNNTRGPARSMPGNAVVLDFLAEEGDIPPGVLAGFLRLFLQDIFSGGNPLLKLKASKVYYRYFCDQWRRFHLIREAHRRWQASGLDLVYYDFWFVNNGLALSLLAEEGGMRIYSNAHSYDLYDERWGCPLPFRSRVVRSQLKVFPDSLFGVNYLKSKVAPALHDKIELSYMGTPDHGVGPFPQSGKLLVVSCSSCTPHKRVERIVDALAVLDSEDIEWVHFGDGPLFDEIQARARGALKKITCTFKGWVQSEELIRFYREQPVHVFVHASEAEGLPVSLMIAASFGVPIVALDAMGIGELVRPGHGSLLRQDATAGELANAILEVGSGRALDGDFRLAGREHWSRCFSVDNYRKLHADKMRLDDSELTQEA